MRERNELDLTTEDHDKACTEVSFLLDIFAATIDDLMGGSTAPVGRIAGRNQGKKLPIHLANPPLSEVLKTLAVRMDKGFEVTFECQSEETSVKFSRCVIRDVCRTRQLELGGSLCRLYHSYLDGIINEITCRPTKSQITSTGEQCEISLGTR